MPTKLNKSVFRQTDELRHEKGATRELIISIEPAGRASAVVGTRLKGTRETFRIGVNTLYEIAVQRHLDKIGKRAGAIRRAEGCSKRSALVKARKELKADLK